MPDLTKQESAYFIASAIVALSVLIGILTFWSQSQPTCWELHASEQQAIENCEQ